MENCFDREIKMISKGFDGENFTQGRKSFTATFQELDPTQKSQHRLHFLITAIFKQSGIKVEDLEPGQKVPVKIDTDVLYDMTVKAIQVLWIETPAFTARMKDEFLSDSGALLDFATWFLAEKLTPFFSTLMPD